jgi:simple sugar transport system ATP-binding protein
MRLREAGSAILLVSEDLDEIMALSDRIAVMSQGKIAGMFDGGAATREEIGLIIATGAPKT